LRAEDEIRHLREENRHLMNCLLRGQGHLAIGQPMPDARMNPKVNTRHRAAQLEANAWREWNETCSSIPNAS
jgi:hypothetical protein